MEGHDHVATTHDDAFVMSPQFGDADLAEWFAGTHSLLKYKKPFKIYPQIQFILGICCQLFI